ncbi:MAG: type II toxin-antitoxin system RelE/ParE family toxin [Clostridia bacterium]|nr:type II toxin-antitoxin system RelE/ParE family toxin [Clostridia bacterium]
MLVLQIKYTKSAVKVINSLDKVMKIRMKNSIEGLTEVPPRGDIKQIQGFNSSLYRLRVGKFRVLYEYIKIDGEQVLLVKEIGSRGDIYK